MTTKKQKKEARIDTRKPQKAKLALFWGKHVISGDCTFIGKKYKDGQIIIEITYTKP